MWSGACWGGGLGNRGACCHRDVDRHQPLADGIDTNSETFEGHRTEQRRSPTFPEDDEGGRLSAVMEKVRAADPTEGPPVPGEAGGAASAHKTTTATNTERQKPRGQGDSMSDNEKLLYCFAIGSQ